MSEEKEKKLTALLCYDNVRSACSLLFPDTPVANTEELKADGIGVPIG